MVAFLFTTLNETMPLFAAAAVRDGGLGLSLSQLSIPLSFSGAVLIPLSLFVFPRVHKRLGSLAYALPSIFVLDAIAA